MTEATERYAPRHARRRRLLGPRGTGVLAAALLAAVGTPAEAFARSAPLPRTPSRLPLGIEPYAPYERQAICYPAAQPGVLAFRDLVLRTYPRTGSDGIVRSCASSASSEHKDGRAWDWRVRADVASERADAQALLRWLLKPDSAGYAAANARRLGLMYVIWDHRIWKSYDASRGWQPYHGGDSHRGHVHFSFSWAGARKQTSYYTKHVAPPILAPSLPMLGAGSAGPAVRDLQQLLRVPRANGHFGFKTRRAVQAFQRRHHLRANGLLTRATWAALLPPVTPIPARVAVQARWVGTPVLREGAAGAAVRQLQRLLGARTDGGFGPATLTALRRFQQRLHLVSDGVAGAQTWRALKAAYARAHPKPIPKLPAPLRAGASGAVVREVQRRLHLRGDGVFGPATETAVRTYQRRHHLQADGVVGQQTWRAVHGGAAPAAPAHKKAAHKKAAHKNAVTKKTAHKKTAHKKTAHKKTAR